MAIIFALYISLIGWFYKRNIAKNTLRVYESGKNTNVFGRRTYVLDGDVFREDCDGGMTTIKLSAVERMDSTDTATYVFISSLSAFIIPRDSVVSGDYESFVTALTAKWNEVRAK